MEFGLDAGQLQLQETVSQFFAERFPVGGIGQEGPVVDRSGWRQMADLGVLGLLAGDAGGGDEGGIGIVEGALVFEQLGFHLVPGPILWTVLTAPFVQGAARGDVLVTGVDESAVRDGSVTAECAEEADVLVVLGARGVVQYQTADLAPAQVLEPLDPLTPVGRFSGLSVGETVGDARLGEHLSLLGTVLSASLLAGLAARALEVGRAYSLERTQFGVPIGSFQAVQHLLADMYVRSVLAQSAAYAAAASAKEPGGGDAALAAASAKVVAADAAIANASSAIQVLGGMGFTWEMLPHLLLKRAWVLENGFGSASEHSVALGANLAGVAAEVEDA